MSQSSNQKKRPADPLAGSNARVAYKKRQKADGETILSKSSSISSLSAHSSESIRKVDPNEASPTLRKKRLPQELKDAYNISKGEQTNMRSERANRASSREANNTINVKTMLRDIQKAVLPCRLLLDALLGLSKAKAFEKTRSTNFDKEIAKVDDAMIGFFGATIEEYIPVANNLWMGNFFPILGFYMYFKFDESPYDTKKELVFVKKHEKRLNSVDPKYFELLTMAHVYYKLGMKALYYLRKMKKALKKAKGDIHLPDQSLWDEYKTYTFPAFEYFYDSVGLINHIRDLVLQDRRLSRIIQNVLPFIYPWSHVARLFMCRPKSLDNDFVSKELLTNFVPNRSSEFMDILRKNIAIPTNPNRPVRIALQKLYLVTEDGEELLEDGVEVGLDDGEDDEDSDSKDEESDATTAKPQSNNDEKYFKTLDHVQRVLALLEKEEDESLRTKFVELINVILTKMHY